MGTKFGSGLDIQMRLATFVMFRAVFAGVEAGPGFGQPATPGGTRSGCPAVPSEGELF